MNLLPSYLALEFQSTPSDKGFMWLYYGRGRRAGRKWVGWGWIMFHRTIEFSIYYGPRGVSA